MPPVSRIASKLGVPPRQLFNLFLLVAFAIISGIGAYIVRSEFVYISFEMGLRGFQFSLVYILLGLLPVLFKRSRGTEGKAISIFLIVSIAIGLSIAPRFDLINLVILFLVLLGGLTYYSIGSNPSNRELILAIGLLLIEGYLFSVYYVWLNFQKTSNLRITVLTTVYLTIALYIIFRMLAAEYHKSTAGVGWMP